MEDEEGERRGVVSLRRAEAPGRRGSCISHCGWWYGDQLIYRDGQYASPNISLGRENKVWRIFSFVAAVRAVQQWCCCCIGRRDKFMMPPSFFASFSDRAWRG